MKRWNKNQTDKAISEEGYIPPPMIDKEMNPFLRKDEVEERKDTFGEDSETRSTFGRMTLQVKSSRPDPIIFDTPEESYLESVLPLILEQSARSEMETICIFSSTTEALYSKSNAFTLNLITPKDFKEVLE